MRCKGSSFACAALQAERAGEVSQAWMGWVMGCTKGARVGVVSAEAGGRRGRGDSGMGKTGGEEHQSRTARSACRRAAGGCSRQRHMLACSYALCSAPIFARGQVAQPFGACALADPMAGGTADSTLRGVRRIGPATTNLHAVCTLSAHQHALYRLPKVYRTTDCPGVAVWIDAQHGHEASGVDQPRGLTACRQGDERADLV
ncbi:hypothetical protein T440DRAFT_298667 [Plenodomus tracheiphilus IPT5]|uniref:Uncharacterized protein n=1 Tax=Plenodomus tracheiphilus IPT5 TaxID=1408161 RepID=A0A6A7AP71_9PLEO|nr:hypothetical protein T440DRAFT_298667 [Plenodomus tracheiphilus IPT5]